MNSLTTIQNDNKYNAIKHGALSPRLLPDELELAESMIEEFWQEYEPEGLTEELLLETMIITHLRRQRAIKAEREFFMQILNPAVFEERVISPPLLKDPVIGDTLSGQKELILKQAGYIAKIDSEAIQTIEKTYARYVVSCERQFYRALHELQRVQAVRKGIRPTSFAMDLIKDEED